MPPALVLRPFERRDFGLLLSSIRSPDEPLAWAGPDVAYERVGFVREGHQRDVARTSDRRWWGSIPMALFADAFRP